MGHLKQALIDTEFEDIVLQDVELPYETYNKILFNRGTKEVTNAEV